MHLRFDALVSQAIILCCGEAVRNGFPGVDVHGSLPFPAICLQGRCEDLVPIPKVPLNLPADGGNQFLADYPIVRGPPRISIASHN
jgi:hypothetical protein